MYKNGGTHNYYNMGMGFNSKFKSLQLFILFGKCPCVIDIHATRVKRTDLYIYICILFYSK